MVAAAEAEMVEVELDEEAIEEEEAAAEAPAEAEEPVAVEEEPVAAEAEEPAAEEAMDMDDPFSAAPLEAPATPEPEPEVVRFEERERDEPEGGAPRARRDVQPNSADATPDVLVSATSGAVSSLSQGGFRHLRSGVRADTGAKAGRYLFEVKVVECDPRGESELRVGLSAAGSSLFLGDGSSENVCFSSEGTYYLADPGQAKAFEKAGACGRMSPEKVVGVLLNLCSEGPNAMTLSVFLDGERAGKPQPVPAHLRGKALYPTLTFRNMTLAVNFGRGGLQLKPLPFKCRMYAELDEAHMERSSAQASMDGGLEVIVPIGLPDRGVFDYAQRLLEERPGCVELSDRKVADWCRRSGLALRGAPTASHSRDRPDFNYGVPELDGRSWRDNLRILVQLSGRSCVLPDVRASLLRPERKELLSKFPASMKKVAVVLIGEPNKSFKDWVHEKIRSEYEAKKELVQKRKDIAEAAGEELSEEELRMPEEPALGDDVCFLPSEGGLADLSERAAAGSYSRFSLPDAEEGFDEVRYEWLGKGEAEEYLQQWVTEKKATLIVDGLKPGTWFTARQSEWHTARQELRGNFSKYKAGHSEAADLGGLKPEDVLDIHDCDGEGTPIYANFKYEDWLLLSWRYELHLLVHAFLEDVADPDYKGIPEAHVPHYFSLYFGAAWDVKGKLGLDSLAAVVKLLKGPAELVEIKPGYKVLQSKLPMTASCADFVRGIETYRRDRARRVEAGDESARLNIPKPAPKAAAKAPAGKASLAKAPAKMAASAKVAAAKAPVAKAKAPVVKAPAPSGPGLKRPPPAAEDGAAKKPRPDGADAAAPTPRGAAMVKRATGQPLAKAPVTKAPVSKAPVAKAPLVKAPVAKRKA